MISTQELLPADADDATLVGRMFDPELGGPCVVVVQDGVAYDISAAAPTTSSLLERDDVLALVEAAVVDAPSHRLDDLVAVVDTDRRCPRLLAPCDLQVLKAAGVTFVESMVERVIEEQAQGDSDRAADIRRRVGAVVGEAIAAVRPGSPEALRVKQVLLEEGLWSQYLEVGIGPDPEVFTKAPILSSVGAGHPIGVLRRSDWNNPEPEVVLAVRSDGVPVGASLGNDVNLRDFEGRSALLLAEAKDNNASCAIGPFIRLFDDGFGLDDVRAMEVRLEVEGTDGFIMDGTSSMTKISRDPLELVGHTHGPHHQYPDGFMLFTGTLFAPTQDRGVQGAGFTHHRDDIVRISNPLLGTLANRVMDAEQAPPWEFGVWDLMNNLASRGLLGDRAPASTSPPEQTRTTRQMHTRPPRGSNACTT